MSEGIRLTGHVESFNALRKFGFIRSVYRNEAPIFVHFSANGWKDLVVGQVVTYEVGQDRRARPCAVNVVTVEE